MKFILKASVFLLPVSAEIPWNELSEQLGPGIVREIAPVEKVFEECAASIEGFGGALLPTIANGTCSFAGVCVFEDCGVVKSEGTEDSAVSSSGLFVESDDLCPSELISCAEAAPCYDHDTGVCGADGAMILEGEAASCGPATPVCDGCFPNSRCGGLVEMEEEPVKTIGESGELVESDICGVSLASCAEAGPCYDHDLGICGEDGQMILEGEGASCATATPFCDACFPNSRCGGAPTADDSGEFVESDVCGAGLEGCADASLCYDHNLGLCGEDGVMTSPDCAPASPACDACFPNSRCGMLSEADTGADSGLFVESASCPPEFAGCADAAPCFDHSIGVCQEDGSVEAPDCAEAIEFCSLCFPNSRCSGSGSAPAANPTPAVPSNINSNKNLPLYSVVATSISHVQHTVEFAAKYDIPLSIKSTGASYSVANQFNDNLLLSMSEFPKHSAGDVGGDSVAAINRIGGEESLITSTITDTAGILDNYIDACGVEHGPAIEIGGGETWGDVFASLAAYNSNRGEGEIKYMLSSGAAVTVGASGGWLQGGGLGPFDRSMGLGIDNVIAFKVVTADGSIKVANACDPETSDLFFALRGGGGGNFGVVVSQISKLHPIKPLIRANVIWMGAPVVRSVTDSLPPGITLSGDMIPDNLAKGSIGTRQTNLVWTKPDSESILSPTEQLDKWWDVMLTVLNPVTMDPNIDGYYGVGCAWSGGYMCADLYFQGTMEDFETTVLAPLREVLDIAAMPDVPATENGPGAAGTGSNFMYIAQQYDDGYYSYASQDCVSAADGSPQAVVCGDLGYPSPNGYNTDAQVDQGGYETRLSWMIPQSIFGTGTTGNPDRPEIVEAAKALFAEPLMSGVTGHVLGGVINEVQEDSTSTSPVMRSSALEGLFPFSYIQALGVQESVDMLSKHLPAPGAVPIFNHDALNLDLLDRLGKANGEDLSWQDLYWGTNLPRLQEIKAKYDPNNVFQCRDCLTTEHDSHKDGEEYSSSHDETHDEGEEHSSHDHEEGEHGNSDDATMDDSSANKRSMFEVVAVASLFAMLAIL